MQHESRLKQWPLLTCGYNDSIRKSDWNDALYDYMMYHSYICLADDTI